MFLSNDELNEICQLHFFARIKKGDTFTKLHILTKTVSGKNKQTNKLKRNKGCSQGATLPSSIPPTHTVSMAFVVASLNTTTFQPSLLTNATTVLRAASTSGGNYPNAYEEFFDKHIFSNPSRLTWHDYVAVSYATFLFVFYFVVFQTCSSTKGPHGTLYSHFEYQKVAWTRYIMMSDIITHRTLKILVIQVLRSNLTVLASFIATAMAAATAMGRICLLSPWTSSNTNAQKAVSLRTLIPMAVLVYALFHLVVATYASMAMLFISTAEDLRGLPVTADAENVTQTRRRLPPPAREGDGHVSLILEHDRSCFGGKKVMPAAAALATTTSGAKGEAEAEEGRRRADDDEDVEEEGLSAPSTEEAEAFGTARDGLLMQRQSTTAPPPQHVNGMEGGEGRRSTEPFGGGAEEEGEEDGFNGTVAGVHAKEGAAAAEANSSIHTVSPPSSVPRVLPTILPMLDDGATGRGGQREREGEEEEEDREGRGREREDPTMALPPSSPPPLCASFDTYPTDLKALLRDLNEAVSTFDMRRHYALVSLITLHTSHHFRMGWRALCLGLAGIFWSQSPFSMILMMTLLVLSEYLNDFAGTSVDSVRAMLMGGEFSSSSSSSSSSEYDSEEEGVDKAEGTTNLMSSVRAQWRRIQHGGGGSSKKDRRRSVHGDGVETREEGSRRRREERRTARRQRAFVSRIVMDPVTRQQMEQQAELFGKYT